MLIKRLIVADKVADSTSQVSVRRTKDLTDPDNHNGVITHLELGILVCEVKWTLGSIITKLVEVTEFQQSYLKF